MTAGEIIGRDIIRDKTGDPCAACGQGGDYRLKRELRSIINSDGRSIPVMLCIDAAACGRRYRNRMSTGAYAGLLRAGRAPLPIVTLKAS